MTKRLLPPPQQHDSGTYHQITTAFPIITQYIYTSHRKLLLLFAHENNPFPPTRPNEARATGMGRFNHDYWLRGLIMNIGLFFYYYRDSIFLSTGGTADRRTHAHMLDIRANTRTDGCLASFPSLSGENLNGGVGMGVIYTGLGWTW